MQENSKDYEFCIKEALEHAKKRIEILEDSEKYIYDISWILRRGTDLISKKFRIADTAKYDIKKVARVKLYVRLNSWL